MSQHQLTVNGKPYSRIDAPSSFQAIAKFIDDFVPDEEKVVFRGTAIGNRVIIKTTSFEILAEPVVVGAEA